MATETHSKATKAGHGVAPPQEPEHLPCPRCDSTNTKFCYYNNYNFSQPRHFCKSCRRYWTHGGTLRDIPVGGGSRKNAKRSRTRASAGNHGGPAVFPSSRQDFRHLPAGAAQHLVPISADHGGAVPFVSDAKMGGSFTSLLNGGAGNGLLALGGLGLGLASGLDDMGFGLGTGFWPITGLVEGGPTSAYSNSSLVGNTWHLDNVESGFVGSADCFALPDLAISSHGGLLK